MTGVQTCALPILVGDAGLLVPPGDVPGFAAAVVRLLRDEPLRLRLGRAGRERAESLFAPEAHAERVLQAYREVT